MAMCEYSMVVQTTHMKIIGFLMKSSKNMTQNWSWKIDENIFHQKYLKQHSLITESVAGDVRDDITPKINEIFMRFHFSDYCRDSHSKCMHCSITLQKRTFFARARSRK